MTEPKKINYNLIHKITRQDYILYNKITLFIENIFLSKKTRPQNLAINFVNTPEKCKCGNALYTLPTPNKTITNVSPAADPEGFP